MVDKKTFDEFVEMLYFYNMQVSELNLESKDNTYSSLVELENIANIIKTRNLQDGNNIGLSDKDWNEIIERNSENYNFLVALVHNFDLPTSVLLNIIKQSIPGTIRYVINSNSAALIQAICSKEFNHEVFDALLNTTQSNLLSGAILKEFPTGNFHFKVNQEYIDKVGRIVFDALKDTKERGLYKLSPDYILLQHISKELAYEFSEIVLKNEEYISTSVVSMLIANKNLDINEPKDVELAKMLLDFCDPFCFEEIPSIVATPLSKLLYESVFLNCIDEKNNKIHDTSEAVFKKFETLFYDAIGSNTLPESIEYDIACRLLSIRLKSDNKLIQKIFSNTQNPELVSRIDELQRTNKMIAFVNNKNISEDYLRKTCSQYCKKIKNHQNKKDSAYPSDWNEIIGEVAHRIPLNDETYDFLISLNNPNLLLDIATSSKTPDKVLNKIVDFCNNAEDKKMMPKRLVFSTYITKFFNEHNVSDNIRKSINLQNIYYNAQIDKPATHILSDKFNPYLDRLNLSEEFLHILSSKDLLKVVNSDINIAKKLSKYITDMLDVPYFNAQKSTLEKIIVCLDETIKFKENIGEDGLKNIGSLAFPYSNLKNNIVISSFSPYLYLNLPSILEEYKDYSNTLLKATEKLDKENFEQIATKSKPPKFKSEDFEQLELF
jgi:hypothetical protein